MAKNPDHPDAVPEAADTAGPPPLPEGGSSSALSSREQSVALELDRIDPQLGGLYRLGIEFLQRADQPGTSYVLAIVGRELNRGVMDRLAADSPQLQPDEAAEIPPDDRFRGTFARALRLSPRHPLVTALAEMNRRFSGEGKYSPDRRGASSAYADFRSLADLIGGRIAPYFEAQDDADFLLAVQPGPEHRESLRRVMVRPALRTYFLRSVTNPAWLEPLHELQSFDAPPMRTVHPDGSWSTRGWLEGEYLARIAAVAPQRVSELLRAIAETNDNPVVWDIAARAAASMDAQSAAALLRHIAVGLRSVPRVIATRVLIDLGKKVAPTDPAAVEELLSSLMWLRLNAAAPGDAPEALFDAGHYSASWLLQRIDEYDAQEVVAGLIPAVASSDGPRAIQFLRDKLKVVLRKLGSEGDSRRDTVLWCSDFDDSEDTRDLRALLARALYTAAVVEANKSEEAARAVLSALRELPEAIASRLVHAVVARSTPFLKAEVDAVLTDPEVFEPEMAGHERGNVLRSRFEEASEGAQCAFAAALEHGPGDEELEAIERRFREYAEPKDRAEALAHWQTRQLRRLGAPLPAVLAPLAERLGYEAQEPDPEHLGLTEVGFYAGGDPHFAFDQSPISDERLGSGPIDEVVREISDFTPASNIDRPTMRGLNDALQRVAGADVARGAALGLALADDAQAPRGVAAVLWGLRDARRGGTALPWESIRALFAKTMEGGTADGRVADWHDARIASIDLLDDAYDDIPVAVAREVFTASLRGLAQPGIWVPPSDEPFSSVEGIIFASLNTDAGRLTRLVIRMALRCYRAELGEDKDDAPRADEIRRRIGSELHEAIDGVLKHEGRQALAARGSLGSLLPQLIWFAPEWWEHNVLEVLASGIDRPLENPIWAVYLARATFYERTFVVLRRWYVNAAQQAGRARAQERTRDWEPDRHLIEHVLIAMVRGLAAVGDADALIETAVDRVPLDDLGHAYWTFFRAWSDEKKARRTIPVAAVTRLVSFWEWRLTQLEAREGGARDEEANHLLWFVRTPFIPSNEAIRLGLRTLALIRSGSRHVHLTWEGIAELSAHDADGAFAMAALAFDIELRSEHVVFDILEIDPIFRNAFAHGTAETRTAATALLHRLGDAGFPEFRRFLPER